MWGTVGSLWEVGQGHASAAAPSLGLLLLLLLRLLLRRLRGLLLTRVPPAPPRPLQRGAARGWPPPLLVGLAFRPQVVESVPMTGHDVPVDILVTPDEVIACSARGAAAAAEHAGRGAAGGGGAAPGWS